MTLTSSTDFHLNRAFAEKVCGWKFLHAEHKFDNGVQVAVDGIAKPDGQWIERVTDFCSDANAVLPWLEENGHWTCERIIRLNESIYSRYRIAVEMERGFSEYTGDSFARTAVIALLGAHGVEIVIDG